MNFHVKIVVDLWNMSLAREAELGPDCYKKRLTRVQVNWLASMDLLKNPPLSSLDLCALGRCCDMLLKQKNCLIPWPTWHVASQWHEELSYSNDLYRLGLFRLDLNLAISDSKTGKHSFIKSNHFQPPRPRSSCLSSRTCSRLRTPRRWDSCSSGRRSPARMSPATGHRQTHPIVTLS